MCIRDRTVADARGGLPGFSDLCRAIAAAYRDRRDDVEAQAAEVARRLTSLSERPASEEALTPQILDDATDPGQGLGRGGGVVERQQRRGEAGGRAALVAQRGRRGQQCHLRPAGVGVACRGGPGGDDERVGHTETVADARTGSPTIL